MLTVKCAPTYKPEREYICRVLLSEFLGLEYILQYEERQHWQISAGNGKELLLPDILFQTPGNKWLRHESLPDQPLACWDTRELELVCPPLIDKKLPVIYGDPDFHKKVSHVSDNSQTSLLLPIDIFGSSFFMLTRYEEVAIQERDAHDRFPASASLAFQAGFLDRPIVNEYVEILWGCMKELQPGLKRKKQQARMSVSCDVDQAYSSYVNRVPLTIKKIVGDIIKRKSFGMAVNSGLNTIASSKNIFHFEPNHTFEWIMDVNETVGNTVMFNFITGSTVPGMDGNYSIDEDRIRRLMHRIYERGHEIGLHGSYGTYKSTEQLSLEASRLRTVMAEENIDQDRLGNRQHYLRWNTPETARNLEQASISYDTTLGYADHPGFRCGTCFEYPMYDLIERKLLRLRQRPLIVMECSVLDDCYLGMGYTDEALELILTLKNRTLQLGGYFTLLWHNSNFTTANDRLFFEAIC